MRYDEIHKRWLGLPAAALEADNIYEYYMSKESDGWNMPTRWLISLEYGKQLKDHPGMYGIRLNEKGVTSVAGIPATVGDFDFTIAVVARDPYQCRVTDFVDPGSLPWVVRADDGRDFVYINSRPLPEYSPAGELLPSARMQIMGYRRRKFADTTRRVWFMWQRES